MNDQQTTSSSSGNSYSSWPVYWRLFKRELRRIFDVRQGFDDAGSARSIEANLQFSGENVILLICAIFIASIGLNTNSTPSVIGAMLISPLMGPIVGAGFAIRVKNYIVFKDSLYHLLLMVAISLMTSTTYFLISPLTHAASELLARTKPTVYDVLVAVFGGIAGVLAATRRERTTNVMAGAAIATALMPPLCTVGYGMANLKLDFILGAGYLFLINAFFIGLATLGTTWMLPFQVHQSVNSLAERRIRRIIVFGAIALLIPSLITGYRSVREIMIDAHVREFVTSEMNFPKSRVLDAKVDLSKPQLTIDITIVGERLSEDAIQKLRSSLKSFELDGAVLNIVNISATDQDAHVGKSIANSLAGEKNNLLVRASEKIVDLEQKITRLESELNYYRQVEANTSPISAELRIIFRDFDTLILGVVPNWEIKSDIADKTQLSESASVRKTLTVAIAKWRKKPSIKDKDRLREFLKTRTGSPDLLVFDVSP